MQVARSLDLAMIFRTLLLAVLLPLPARADELKIAPAPILDEKPVIATVETVTLAPARIRTGGTVKRILVREGERVAAGQALVEVVDEKLVDRVRGAEGRAAAARAQADQSGRDLIRDRPLVGQGVISPSQIEAEETAERVAAGSAREAEAELAAQRRQLAEGQVVAPAAGRVTRVPVSLGMVMMQGEVAALVATAPLVLRLQVPERFAALIKPGDAVRLANGTQASVTLVYPHIENGIVTVDAKGEGIGDYFVGETLDARLAMERREAILLPTAWLIDRFGLDYVRLRVGDGLIEVPVQRGRSDAPGMVEILSGLKPGDIAVRP